MPVGKSHSCSWVIDLRNAQALEIWEWSFQYKSHGSFQSFKATSLVFRPITRSSDGLSRQPSAIRIKARCARANLYSPPPSTRSKVIVTDEATNEIQRISLLG